MCLEYLVAHLEQAARDDCCATVELEDAAPRLVVTDQGRLGLLDNEECYCCGGIEGHEAWCHGE